VQDKIDPMGKKKTMLAVAGLILAKEARFGVEGVELGSCMLNSVIYKLHLSACIEVASLGSEARSSAVWGGGGGGGGGGFLG